jgi:hypothetical protein
LNKIAPKNRIHLTFTLFAFFRLFLTIFDVSRLFLTQPANNSIPKLKKNLNHKGKNAGKKPSTTIHLWAEHQNSQFSWCGGVKLLCGFYCYFCCGWDDCCGGLGVDGDGGEGGDEESRRFLFTSISAATRTTAMAATAPAT